MTLAGTGYSKLKNAEEAAKAAAKAAMTCAGVSKADLVLFFTSTKYKRSYLSILQILKEITGAKHIVGASGFGVLTNEIEFEKQAGIGVLVVSSDSLEIDSFLIPHLQESSYRAGETAGRQLRERLQAKLAMIFPDPFSFQSHLFFDGFENATGYVPLLGGSAAEDGRESKTYQMGSGRVTHDAVSGIALGGNNVRFETGLARSCRPFGEALKITRADGHTIYEIDGRPAYDVLLESVSSIDIRDTNQVLQNIFLGLPLKNYQTDFTKDHYLVRNIMGVNAKKGMMTCTSPVEEGEFVTFTYRDASLARLDMRFMLRDLKDKLGTSKPTMGFYFNCCARGEMLYGKQGEDVAIIREYFPDLPVVGFFSFGEIAPVDFVNHLHQHSGVLTVLAED